MTVAITQDKKDKGLFYCGEQSARSVKALAQKAGSEPYDIGANGSDVPHYIRGYHFIYSSGVAWFCKEHECFWLLDVVESYIGHSRIHVDGRTMNYTENPGGDDDFLVVFLQKTEASAAWFTLEQEVYDDDQEDYIERSIVAQFIPYTDIDVDCVKFYLENGMLMFPSER